MGEDYNVKYNGKRENIPREALRVSKPAFKPSSLAF